MLTVETVPTREAIRNIFPCVTKSTYVEGRIGDRKVGGLPEYQVSIGDEMRNFDSKMPFDENA